MADDPSLFWHLASPFGIEIDEAANAWHSGHIDDIIRFTDTPAMLVASESGGVWLISDGNDPVVLSNDWDVPDVKCLAMGPDGLRHVFAGCTVAYDGPEKRTYRAETGSAPVIMETDASAVAPLLEWKTVNGALPVTAGRITRMVVIPHLRRIVVACAVVRGGDVGGIYWANIPPTRFAPGDPPRPPFAWKQAKVANLPGALGFWDLALAATTDQNRKSNLEDRRAITLVAGGFSGGGLAVGQWNDADELVFERAAVAFNDGTDATSVLFGSCGTSSVTSCEAHPSRLYAACAWPDGRLNSVVQSKDGGRNWSFCAGLVDGSGDPPALIQPIAGDQGANWNNCISVHPEMPNLVALAWVSGPFLSFDFGGNWRLINGGVHVHSDFHALHFAAGEPGSVGFLFVGNDGGVASINLDDLPGDNGSPFRSDYNRALPTLQCFSSLYRQFTGSIDASVEVPGIVAAGLQDNGNVSCRLRPTVDPWRRVDDGDGGTNTFVANAGYLHNWISATAGPVIATAPLGPDVRVATIPIAFPAPANPNGLVALIIEAAIAPTFRNPTGQLLVAMAAKAGSNDVHGLFTVADVVPPYEWRLLGSLPSEQTVSALASFSGVPVLVGTAQGKMYRVDPGSGAVTEQTVTLPKPTPSTKMSGGAFTRIVGFNGASIFAALLGASEVKADGSPKLGTPAVQTYVMRLDGDIWSPTAGAGLPNELLYGLVAVVAPNTRVPRALLAATDDAVYISRENADTWQRASMGLPRRAHCGDLRFVIDSMGSTAVYLGTFGRSLWIAEPTPL